MSRDEIRDDEITVDVKTKKLDGMKTTSTRYYTLSARTALLLIGFFCIAAWAGVMMIGWGFGRLSCA